MTVDTPIGVKRSPDEINTDIRTTLAEISDSPTRNDYNNLASLLEEGLEVAENKRRFLLGVKARLGVKFGELPGVGAFGQLAEIYILGGHRGELVEGSEGVDLRRVGSEIAPLLQTVGERDNEDFSQIISKAKEILAELGRKEAVFWEIRRIFKLSPPAFTGTGMYFRFLDAFVIDQSEAKDEREEDPETAATIAAIQGFAQEGTEGIDA